VDPDDSRWRKKLVKNPRHLRRGFFIVATGSLFGQVRAVWPSVSQIEHFTARFRVSPSFALRPQSVHPRPGQMQYARLALQAGRVGAKVLVCRDDRCRANGERRRGERLTITGDPSGRGRCAERLAACSVASVGHPHQRWSYAPMLMPPNVIAVTGLAFEARIAAGRQCSLCDRTLAVAQMA
jgi:hypothetical protein